MIYVDLNIKGGVGKTTTSINLAAGLANVGQKVLLIDFDGQANATSIVLNTNIYDDELSIVEALVDPKVSKQAIRKTELGFDIMPSRLNLFVIEKKIMLDCTTPQQNRLLNVIKQVNDDYDHIIIDCNPSLNMLSSNAVFSCKNEKGIVIIPIKVDKGATDGFSATINFINEMNEGFDLNIDYRVLITMMNRNNLDKSVVEDLTNIVGDKLFQTKIRNQSKPITEAGYNQRAVISNLKANVGLDYRNFVNEIIGKG